MKLALGTAQFGLPYGIANRTGQVSPRAATDILAKAASAGIDTLDTAIAYGESERRLGEAGIAGWKVVTKLPRIPDGCGDVAGWVADAARAALGRLRLTSLYGLLLHRPEQLLGPDGPALYAGLSRVKDAGLVGKIGVSIYDPAELAALCSSYRFDLVQAPFNLLDRRLIRSGWLARLAAGGIEVHARSIFLQGVLLMPPGQRPPAFDRWADLWAAYHRWLDDTGLTPLQACLRDALAVDGIGRIIVGIETAGQLEADLDAASGPAPAVPEALATDDPDLLNPARWSIPR